MNKDKLFKFIKLKCESENLIEILDVEVKDYDDEFGLSNNHFFVKCLLAVPDPSYISNNFFGRKEKTCLVNISEYEKWLNSEEAIKWL